MSTAGCASPVTNLFWMEETQDTRALAPTIQTIFEIQDTETRSVANLGLMPG